MAAPDTHCQQPRTDFHLAINRRPGTRKRGQRRHDSGSGSSPIVPGMSAADLIADRYPRIPGSIAGAQEMIFF
jgi:hypothetical protein